LHPTQVPSNWIPRSYLGGLLLDHPSTYIECVYPNREESSEWRHYRY
jgi:hypothetical protein